jgi:hypothetical protein
VFHHSLIRRVANESQLKSDRAELHRRVAAAIESRDLATAEENAALIAEHLEAAGDLHAAYGCCGGKRSAKFEDQHRHNDNLGVSPTLPTPAGARRRSRKFKAQKERKSLTRPTAE